MRNTVKRLAVRHQLGKAVFARVHLRNYPKLLYGNWAAKKKALESATSMIGKEMPLFLRFYPFGNNGHAQASPQNDRGMLPGLDSISAEDVLKQLSLLKYRNARGSHIYVRPSGEHRYTVLDDLNETMLTRLAVDGFNPCAIVETSAGNFQAWLTHRSVFPKLLGTFAAQTSAERCDADPSAADWRRFGRLPGFTNCKPKYRKPDGLFPFVRQHSHSGQQYPMADAFEQEITRLYETREQEHEVRRLQSSPRRGPRLSSPSLEGFRSSSRYQGRPAAADIAFCVAAFADGMTEDRIGCALADNYLSRDPSPSRRAAYIRRTMAKARRWIER